VRGGRKRDDQLTQYNEPTSRAHQNVAAGSVRNRIAHGGRERRRMEGRRRGEIL